MNKPIRIAVASGKGGTGKTTVAVNLAAALGTGPDPAAYVDCDVEEPIDSMKRDPSQLRPRET